MDKDTIYSIVISITLIIGLINLYYTIKNRKNPLREHVYKEQLVAAYKLIAAFYHLNLEVTRIFNARLFTGDNFENSAQAVGEALYQYEHIMIDQIVTLANEVVTGSEDFLMSIAEGDREKINLAYQKYFENYFLLVQALRDSFGIDELSKENQSLYKLPAYLKNIMKK